MPASGFDGRFTCQLPNFRDVTGEKAGTLIGLVGATTAPAKAQQPTPFPYNRPRGRLRETGRVDDGSSSRGSAALRRGRCWSGPSRWRALLIERPLDHRDEVLELDGDAVRIRAAR